MKILVKHVDNLRSTWNPDKETVPEYLVYHMADNNTPISCEVVYGEQNKDFQVKMLQISYQFDKIKELGLNPLEANPDFTLPVEEVSYSEFRNNDSLDMFR